MHLHERWPSYRHYCLEPGPAWLHGPDRGTGPGSTNPTWVSMQGNVVKLTLIAAYNGTNAGYNFNGAAHGQMTVTVPLGSTVNATFKNAVRAPHDVVIIPYAMPLPGSGTTPAFAGAASPRPSFGSGGPSAAPGTPVSFSFVANKAGNYMIICGISGHALAGMWDTLVVSPTAKTATVAFTQAGVANAPVTTAPPTNTLPG